MAASSFETWLFGKLRSLNTDHEVFGSYILGIFDSEDSEDDKREALEGILGEVTENTEALCDELLSQWKKFDTEAHTNGKDDQIVVDMDAKLASIMEEQARCVVTERQRTAEEQKLREVILAQCNQMDQEDEEQASILVDPGGGELAASGGPAAEVASALPMGGRNSNTDAVMQADKEKREKSKQDHEKKKAQDKLNKEKQKQQQQERKEKEKKRTQKGERKR